MRYGLLIIFLLAFNYATAEVVPKQISPKYCIGGPHYQPEGLFAIYVFCDDALGTNIVVYLNKLGDPLRGKYDLGNRFWQGEKWSYDVTSYAWLPNKSLLLVSTSAIYGSGSLYLLNVEKQESKVLYHLDGAVLKIMEVGKNYVLLEYEVEYGKRKSVRVAM